MRPDRFDRETDGDEHTHVDGDGHGTDDFHAVKEHFDEEAHSDGHGTEMGWLVSYADMMTLLFGLFVILFSLATDKSKSVDGVMKEVSSKYFNSVTSQPKVGTPGPPGTEAVAKPKITESEVNELHVKLEKEQRTLQEQSKKLALEKADLESAREALETSKSVANGQGLSVKKMQEQLKSAQSAFQADGQKMQTEIESLKKALDTKSTENQHLQDEVDKLSKGQSKSPMQSYMMVMLTWETEKHDIDLQVLNPNSKLFSFKRRKIKGEPGEFTIDSRYGPGIEMWKSENFLPGTYHAKVLLYSKNGNLAPAQAHLTVITNRSTYKSEAVVLPNKGDEGDIAFTIDGQGTVTFGK